MFGLSTLKLIMYSSIAILFISIGFGICEQFWVKPLKSKLALLEYAKSTQDATIRQLQEYQLMQDATIKSRLKDKDITIARLRKICSDVKPSLPEGGVCGQVISDTVTADLNSMFTSTNSEAGRMSKPINP